MYLLLFETNWPSNCLRRLSEWTIYDYVRIILSIARIKHHFSNRNGLLYKLLTQLPVFWRKEQLSFLFRVSLPEPQLNHKCPESDFAPSILINYCLINRLITDLYIIILMNCQGNRKSISDLSKITFLHIYH